MLKCVVAKQRLRAPLSVRGLVSGYPKKRCGCPWCVQTRASKPSSPCRFLGRLLSKGMVRGFSVMAPEVPVDGMWDPLLLWQVPVYSRYLLRPPSSAFWAALTLQPQNTAFLQACDLRVGSLAPIPPLCLALSEQLQVEPCLSQTVEKCCPIRLFV